MRTMTGPFGPIGVAALLLLVGTRHPARAEALALTAPSGWQPAASVTPWSQGSARLGGGGSLQGSGAVFRAGTEGPIVSELRGGLTLSYEFTGYTFSSPAAFGNVAPWTDAQHLGLTAPLVFLAPGEWIVLVSPSVDSFMESGAAWGKTLTYGGVLAVSRSLGPGRVVGLGVSVFDRLEEVAVFPFPVISWRFTDRLWLQNPLQASPTGAAGLELSYRLDGGWSIGAGSAYRSTRFRLREHGPFPNGIGEESAIPAFAHAGRRLGQHLALDLYAGALLRGRLRVESSSGHRLAAQGFEPAPIAGGALSARF